MFIVIGLLFLSLIDNIICAFLPYTIWRFQLELKSKIKNLEINYFK